MTDNDLLELYTDISRQQLTYVEQRVTAFGLHAGQAAVISALGKHGPCTQKEIAQLRHVSAPTISVMIARMEREGLVTKEPADGRYSRITLTDKGEQMCRILAEDRVGEPDRVFAGLSPEERDAAAKIFRTISENLQRLTEQANQCADGK